jgi:hypothetical protein
MNEQIKAKKEEIKNMELSDYVLNAWLEATDYLTATHRSDCVCGDCVTNQALSA